MITLPKRAYTAGPMTGVEFHNFPMFYDYQYALEALGIEVENPADNDGGTDWRSAYEAASKVTHPWEYYLKRDLRRLLTCDAVVVLPGWRKSRGAQLETYVARKLGMPIYRLDEQGQIAPLYTLVGLSAYAQSGKDTAAAVLVEHFGFERRAFADPLRQAVYNLNPILEQESESSSEWRYADAIDCYGYEAARSMGGWKDEIRGLLQRMGTEVGRNMFGENIWVDTAFNTLEDGGKYVFADTRFPNEANEIKAWGGSIWRISRKGVGPANQHPSETSLDDYPWDALIQNDGDLSEFRATVFEHADANGFKQVVTA